MADQHAPSPSPAAAAAEVVKILQPAECAELVKSLVFQGSADDLRDGFIHLSTPEQTPGTVARHFQSAEDLWLARLDPAALGADLRWEESRGGALFPHLYAPLRAAHVRALAPLPRLADGGRRYPWDPA